MDKLRHESVNFRLKNVLRVLISAGADVNMICNGFTALIYACICLTPGSRSHIGRSSGRDPRHEVVEILLQHSTAETINFRDVIGYTALIHAGDARIIQSLVDSGADVHALINNGLNALTLNCLWPSPCPEIMRVLIAAGSSFINCCNDDGDSLVMMFIKSCRTRHLRSELILDVLRILVETGVDMSARNNEGKSVLLVAVETLYRYDQVEINHEVIKLLIAAGAAAMLNMCGIDGLTLFTAMNCYGRMLNSDMILFMIRCGLNVTDISRSGETALMRILRNIPVDNAAVETLLRNGASETINHICPDGRCALALAVSPFNSQPTETVRLLIQYRADLSIPAVSMSALTMACGSPSLTRLLLDLGADVNARDANGQTVILRRLAPGNESFRMLIDAGARLMDTDNDGNTSVMCLFEDTFDCDITAEIETICAEIDRYHRF
jgi:ankyrin repeat protein